MSFNYVHVFGYFLSVFIFRKYEGNGENYSVQIIGSFLPQKNYLQLL